MNRDVTEMIEQMFGKPCSQKQVGRGRSLSLGFGNVNLNDKSYREWDVRTYSSAWRVVRAGLVLCGSQNVVDSIAELNLILERVDLGRFVSLRQITDLDVRIELDNETAVDFLATSNEDECLNIFCPGQRVIVFSIRGGWKMGPSDKPWPNPQSP